VTTRRDATWELMAAIYPLVNVASVLAVATAACSTRRRRRARCRRTRAAGAGASEAMPVMQGGQVAIGQECGFNCGRCPRRLTTRRRS
jgi:hypothetical protein